MNDYSNGGILPAGLAVTTKTTGRPERVVPYSGLFLEPDVEPVDEEEDES